MSRKSSVLLYFISCTMFLARALDNINIILPFHSSTDKAIGNRSLIGRYEKRAAYRCGKYNKQCRRNAKMTQRVLNGFVQKSAGQLIAETAGTSTIFQRTHRHHATRDLFANGHRSNASAMRWAVPRVPAPYRVGSTSGTVSSRSGRPEPLTSVASGVCGPPAPSRGVVSPSDLAGDRAGHAGRGIVLSRP